MVNKIDFVITWVDSNDPNWILNYNKYVNNEKYETVGDYSEARFRDWDNLKYWFRGVEKFAPWVNKIHFITAGHVPKWLNVNNPKLNVVKHSDYIPKEYLPTFNSRVIELNLPFIDELSETFVLFNDDFFITSNVEPDDFFYNEKPLDSLIYNAESGGGLSPVIMNNLELINIIYSKKKKQWNMLDKLFNFKNGLGGFRNILLFPWPRYTGFYESHLPQSYLKSECNKAYYLFKADIIRTCKSRFRLKSDVNHYIYRYFQMLGNNFSVRKPNHLGRFFILSNESLDTIIAEIENGNYKVMALNDSSDISDFELVKKSINYTFYKKWPNRSSFEI